MIVYTRIFAFLANEFMLHKLSVENCNNTGSVTNFVKLPPIKVALMYNKITKKFSQANLRKTCKI